MKKHAWFSKTFLNRYRHTYHEFVQHRKCIINIYNKQCETGQKREGLTCNIAEREKAGRCCFLCFYIRSCGFTEPVQACLDSWRYKQQVHLVPPHCHVTLITSSKIQGYNRLLHSYNTHNLLCDLEFHATKRFSDNSVNENERQDLVHT